MNHKPGSVANLTVGVGVFQNSRVGFIRRFIPNKTFFPLTAICLGTVSQPPSLQPTRGIGRAALPLLDFAPDEACRFPVKPGSCRYCYQYRGGLLPRHFTFAVQLQELPGCMLSVALSVLAGLAAKPGCYPASCPAEPGLSSLGSSSR